MYGETSTTMIFTGESFQKPAVEHTRPRAHVEKASLLLKIEVAVLMSEWPSSDHSEPRSGTGPSVTVPRLMGKFKFLSVDTELAAQASTSTMARHRVPLTGLARKRLEHVLRAPQRWASHGMALNCLVVKSLCYFGALSPRLHPIMPSCGWHRLTSSYSTLCPLSKLLRILY